MDTTFRTQTDTKDNKPLEFKESKNKTTGEIVDSVEVPYTDFEAKNGIPYIAEHYDLGSLWNENGVFDKEVGLIDGFIRHKIDKGEWANDQKTIKRELKKMEKLTGVKDEARAIVRLETMAAHIKFLMEADKIKLNAVKYGNK